MNSRLKRRPTHPGAILREDVLPELGLSPSEFAKVLEVSPWTINQILKERSRLTVDLAQRIGIALTMAPEIWLRMQQAVDLYDLRGKNRKVYSRIHPVAA